MVMRITSKETMTLECNTKRTSSNHCHLTQRMNKTGWGQPCFLLQISKMPNLLMCTDSIACCANDDLEVCNGTCKKNPFNAKVQSKTLVRIKVLYVKCR
jgi:hypothetical protein